jgi:hypothetical protein
LTGTRKGQGCTKTQKGHTFGKKRRANPEGINGIRIQGIKELLGLGSKGNINKTFRETLELENAKRIAGSSDRIRKMSVRTLWRGRPPPKRKKRPLTAD